METLFFSAHLFRAALHTMWDLSSPPGIKPATPAVEAVFPTGPLGKFQKVFTLRGNLPPTASSLGSQLFSEGIQTAPIASALNGYPIKKTQLLAALIHPPPLGESGGLKRLDRPPRSCLVQSSVPSVGKVGTGRGNILSTLLWDAGGATPCECLRREVPAHISSDRAQGLC